MPKLRLFRGPDPLDSDTIPFPRSCRDEPQFRLRLSDSIREVETALGSVEHHLSEARFLMTSPWFDDDGPRAA